jgi:hypothetical protein
MFSGIGGISSKPFASGFQSSSPSSAAAASAGASAAAGPKTGAAAAGKLNAEQQVADRFPDAGEVVDGTARAMLWLVKLVRVMLLWIVVHFVDKAYQQSYIIRSATDQPLPMLWTLAGAALAAEAAALLLLFAMLWMLKGVYKRRINTFVVDAPFLARLARHYAATTALLLALGSCFGHRLQHSSTLRYREDGVRAVRTTSLMFFYAAALVLLAPAAGI